MTLVHASDLDAAELARLFTRGYEGYFVPIELDEASLSYVVDAWDVDLARSRVAPGEGVCFLAVRGDRGWIGGLGVVPEARRRGVGRRLMEAVLAEAPPVVTLEVIDRNEPAIRLYESLGFETTRILEVWSLPAVPEVEATPAPFAPVGEPDPPWQRADASLPGEGERLELDGGAILLRGDGVLQLEASDEDTAAQLLSRGRALRFVNVPEGSAASRALGRLGGTVDLRQHEMRRSA